MNREYVIVCMRHKGIIRDALLFWGSRTSDEEERHLNGYTVDIDKCEILTLDEVKQREFDVVSSYERGIPATGDFAVKVDDLLKWGYKKFSIIA